MPIPGLVELFAEEDNFRRLGEGLKKGYTGQFVTGLAGSQRSYLIAALNEGRPVLAVTHNTYQAERLHADLVTLLGPDRAYLFPDLEIFAHEEITQNPDLEMQRLTGLEKLIKHERAVIVAPVRALMRRMAPLEVFGSNCLSFSEGERVDLSGLAGRLVIMGYQRVEMVEGPGHFSIRGGIIDIYPLSQSMPMRVELFDDEIDSIRRFDLASQRSVDKVGSVTIIPAREVVFPRERIDAALPRLQQETERQGAKLEKLGKPEEARALREKLGEHLTRLRESHYFPGVDQYLPYLYDALHYLPDYLEGGLVILDEPARIQEQARQTEEELGEMQAGLLERGRVLPGTGLLYGEWQSLFNSFRRHRIIYLSLLSRRFHGADPQQIIMASSRTPEMFHGKVEELAGELAEWKRGQNRVVLALSSQDRCLRLLEGFREQGVDATYVPEVHGELRPGNIVITEGSLENGFEFPLIRLIVLTDSEVFGRERKHRRSARSAEDGIRISTFAELKVGDYVVHVNHGIGQYQGVETLEIGKVHKDYLVVKYAGGDKLYVPTEQVNLLQKYIGVEGVAPKLYKLGGSEWARVKSRVKESVQELAQNLLTLYAERETVLGHTFAPDTVWQEEFEDTFIYDETPDQLRALMEIKRDMEKPKPMDRLLCGDVGYGKTEVAIRASFKAVMDGKQVGVLVPTTILAQQHYNTFRDRFNGFPVAVEVLSRFESDKEAAEITRRLRRGEIDVIIGTHRLLQKDVVFKDLGLVIVDEEQRFGVAQKERLKELRRNVDVLTLTATPIPRTLHMSLAGVRDMSIIGTPPEDRFPIRTYVMEYHDEVIREAILREMGRDGQVYFVYNRVQSIDKMASYLQQLVPEAKIAVGHGQMEESRLEQVMMDFLRGEYDILLSTTIIESGLDIPNVNTLVVYDADKMGLAQLYQLRGRVGRSNRVAYAYFTYRKDKILTEEAEKRLQAIKEFTELGSGFKIAMRDLEIRGAGNILGSEQHGFIASVGFDLYTRLLDQSIKELKGEAVPEPPEPVLDLNIDAYLPDEYIPDGKQKVEMYKKIITINDEPDLKDVEEELTDRFGDLPEPVANLLKVAWIKVLARQVAVASIITDRTGASIKFHEGLSLGGNQMLDLVRKYKGKVSFLAGKAPQVRLKSGVGGSNGELLQLMEKVLAEIKAF
ncbi:MAG: transcription-repair coupling factor [Firmicutes bacterium]|nr:transcription-repair coupling factor [Bacillota bacterium]